jgi:peptide chain release factor 2
VNDLATQLDDCIEMIEIAISEGDEPLIDELEGELEAIAKEAEKRRVECLFAGEADSNNCFLEVHSGAGGTESDDWAAMLLRMYTRWCDEHNFKFEIIDSLDGEETGVKSVTLKIAGENAYGWLKSESGVHRLVRISPFSSTGKRHTSFASVWVYPQIDTNINIEINDADLRIDTYRASGAGGQHVNTTDSAVRITHIPTGVVVQSQNNRSQHKNKDECMSMLRSRLYERELQKREEEIQAAHAGKTAIGWGHQIRSYVLHPYHMVKDLRTGHHTSDTDGVLGGRLDDFMIKFLEAKATGQGLNLQDDIE